MTEKTSFFLQSFWQETCEKVWPESLGWTAWRRSSTQSPEGVVTAFLGRRTVMRHRGLVPSRVVALNQTVFENWDQVFIEFNGFFGEPRKRFSANLQTLIEELCADKDWDEFRLAGLQQSEYEAAWALSMQHGLRARLIDQRIAPYRHLLPDRSAGSVLSGLSSNLRSQLKRSQRKLEETLGPLVLEHATDALQAWDWLGQLAPWHQARWRNPNGTDSSGFSNPSFVQFHQVLINQAFERDCVRLWRLRAGNHVISIVYNLRTETTESFYLGAVNPDVDARFQSGLLAHVLIMDQCLREGLEFYDFMAGDSRYKRQLASGAETLYWIVLQRPRLRFFVEDFLRRWRDTFNRSLCVKTARSDGRVPPSRQTVSGG